MLKFKQNTELSQAYSSPQSLTDSTEPIAETAVTAEESASQPLRETPIGPSLLGAPFARRNLFGVEWGRLHPRNLKNIRLRRPQHARFIWTRSRKIAAVTLGITGLVAGRWLYASLAPTVMLPPNNAETISGPNAQHFYAAAMEALSDTASNRVEAAYTLLDPGPRTMRTLAERRAAMQSGAPTLALLRQGFAYEFRGLQSSWSKEQVSPYNLSSPVPNFVRIRTLSRLLAVEASVLAADGRYAAAVSSSLDAIRFGQDVGRMPSLISAMIGTLIQHTGSKEALLSVNRLTASEARQAIPRMARLIENEPTMTQIIEGERLFGNGSLQEIMKPQASSALALAGLAFQDDLYSTAAVVVGHSASVFWYTNQGIVDAYNHYMDRVLQQASLPYSLARFPSEAQQKSLPPLVGMMVPNFERAHTSVTRSRTRNRVLLTQLAVQAYRQEHNGALPKTLEDLTRGATPYLTTIPADLFSPPGTDPLRYANGRVYSVGENGKDDAGAGDDTLE